jgi:CheY-like chemotaxis protein
MIATLDPPVTVLIVDDSEDQSALIRRHFERAGCSVVVADTAESAIEAYDTIAPDLAIVDLMLPGMSGWDLAEYIHVAHPDCPVAISSVLDPQAYPPTEAALPKPVTRQTVRQVLSDCVPRWVMP